MFKTPILMLKMTFFWLLFCGKFEQKTQKSISFKNQWRLKNIKKAMVVKNIIAEDMPFTKSIFEQFWRSYCKKTIFVVFHFLKFLPKGVQSSIILNFVWKIIFQPCFVHETLIFCQNIATLRTNIVRDIASPRKVNIAQPLLNNDFKRLLNTSFRTPRKSLVVFFKSVYF